MNLKASRYNLYFPSTQKGTYLIYNTLTEGTVLTSQSGLKAIHADIASIPPARQQALVKTGILVPASIDERRIFRVNHNRLKYSTKECYVMLYTTYACNLACTYCYESFLSPTKGRSKAMEQATARAAAKLVRNLWSDHGFRKIRLFFFGGEPLLNPDPILSMLEELTPWAASKGIDFSNAICTNGTLPLQPLLPQLIDFGTFFHFTIDGPKAVHNARRPYRGGQGTFDDIMSNVSLVAHAGADFGIRINIDKRNTPHVKALLQQLKTDLGEGLTLRFAEVIPPLGEANQSAHCSWAEQCFMGSDPRMMLSLMALARDMGMTVVTRPLRDWVFCEFLREHAYIIDPYGDIYKCEGLAGIKEHKAGTLRDDGTIEPTFALYDWVSHDPLDTECRECVYLPACGGGCPCLTFEEEGTYHTGGCTMFKRLLHAYIAYYLASMYPGVLSIDQIALPSQ